MVAGRPDQLDLNRTKYEGVAALRRFLEYAEGRALIIEESTIKNYSEDCEGIKTTIRRVLAENGYQTDLSVGRSEYRVDVGVIDPQNPQQYILGIMLDGYSYENSKTTRDRELAQIDVLKGLGWKIIRVWCMDWWDNSDKELRKILDVLKNIQDNSCDPEHNTPPDTEKLEPTYSRIYTDVPKTPSKTAPIYKAVMLPARYISAESFTDPRNEQDIQNRIRIVVDEEAPISLSLLTKRVVQSYGIARSGNRIQSHFNSILRRMGLQTTVQNGTFFYWRRDQIPEAYCGLRIDGIDSNHRDVRDIAAQEIANAIYVVLYEQISMDKEDLLREAANKLGYTRLGSNVTSSLELGLSKAQMQGGITTGNTGAFVLTDVGTVRAETILQDI